MKSLETLLEEVGSAVRQADFARLGMLAPDLEAALEQLEKPGGGQIARGILERLKAKANQNAALLDAARRGMRAARRRVEDGRRAAQGLQTYDVHGKRAEFVTSHVTAGRF